MNTNKQEKINMGQTMEQLREEMEQCRKCDLWQSRNHLIFGEGNDHAPQESAACLPWLNRQLELVDPRIMILLGATALKYMAGTDYRITRVRGNWIRQGNRLMMPVYHPSALLRNPALKRDTWEDFKKAVYKYRELVDPDHYSPHIPLNGNQTKRES
ncbi:uracil-DNA glycosylase [Petrimonas mucosa]|uniref:uracil-DNA glycosylase n=1 Tax=Petrimonas mucosa TaxID=1642646 RepID=UPI0023F13091|nr:uracil-DNA glycosylase [Petrimonas mucosa]